MYWEGELQNTADTRDNNRYVWRTFWLDRPNQLNTLDRTNQLHTIKQTIYSAPFLLTAQNWEHNARAPELSTGNLAVRETRGGCWHTQQAIFQEAKDEASK